MLIGVEATIYKVAVFILCLSCATILGVCVSFYFGLQLQIVLQFVIIVVHSVSVSSLLNSACLVQVDLSNEESQQWSKTLESMFFCSLVLRIVTPLQSISSLFIADIGRYIGHTAAELQEIREGLVVLARGARLLLWLGAGVMIASIFGADPLVALSGFGAGTLFVGLALHKSVEDACAVVCVGHIYDTHWTLSSLLHSVPCSAHL